jgi:hypothetical protein
MAVATKDFTSFKQRVDRVVFDHLVVTDNTYTKWFAKGEATADEVRHLAVQFSVFSHQFVIAQLHKVINSADLESYRAGKEILMNELGVIFRSDGSTTPADVDPDIVGVEGTVDGGLFRFKAAHFEWLLAFGRPLGLGFDDMGKRRNATASTLFFSDELIRIYGAEDPSVAEGASFAVENWAAAGFWKELISGLEAFKTRECPKLPLGFWIWHDRLEEQHAAHTQDELVEAFEREDFDEDRFCAGAKEMLDGVQAFWDGLWKDREAT